MMNISYLLQQTSEGKYHTHVIGIKKFRCVGNILSVPQQTDLKMCGVCVCQNVDLVFQSLQQFQTQKTPEVNLVILVRAIQYVPDSKSDTKF